MNHKTVFIITVISFAVIYFANATQEESQSKRSHFAKNSRRARKDSETDEAIRDRPRSRHRRVRLKQADRNERTASESDPDISQESNQDHSIEVIHNEGLISAGSEHEPLYGSEPPVVEPDNQQYWEEAQKVHMSHDPHNILYADHAPRAIAGTNNLDDRLNSNNNIPTRRRNRIADSLDGLSQEMLFPDKSDFSEFSYDDDVSVDPDIDRTTQGHYINSNEVENKIDLDEQGSWDDPDFLKDMVLDLRDKLRESETSQRVTRSVINTLEEKQTAQGTDLQILKDEVLRIRHVQQDQHQMLMEVQEQVSNNEWGVRDIKDMNDQMTHDFSALKTLQLAHNDTMILLSDLSDTNMAEHEEHASAIKHLQHELLRVRTQQQRDGDLIYELQESLSAEQEEEEVEGGVEVEDYNPRQHHNNIPVVPSLPDDASSENSGVGSSEQDMHTFDQLASSIEERHNVIGHHISRIVEREERIEQELSRLRSRFVHYDTQLAHLHTSLLNISLQVAHSENHVLNSQNHDIASQLMNFTQQLMHLQHWHMSTKASVNTTWSNQQMLSELENALERQSRRIEHLEERSERSREHRARTLDSVEGLDEKVSRLENTVQRHEGTVAHLQIKMLNESLDECESAGSLLKVELQMQELDTGLTKVEKRLDTNTDKMSKFERGVSKLFELSDKQGHALSRLVDTVEEVGTVLPAISGLQVDVQNLLSELPRDCNDILLADPAARSGVYLLHAQGSATSVRLPCEFEGESAWTVLQRRADGNTSFALEWDDYKYGFGNPSGEFWIGNDHLHFLTSQDNYQLQIDMIDLYDRYTWARYDVFHIANEGAMYALEISGYQGNATDALQYSNHMPFSTVDRDNDVSSTNCAKFYTAGWWYKHCHYANLNGRYTVGIVWFDHDEDQWSQKKSTVMKIRPLKQQYSARDNRVLLDD